MKRFLFLQPFVPIIKKIAWSLNLQVYIIIISIEFLMNLCKRSKLFPLNQSGSVTFITLKSYSYFLVFSRENMLSRSNKESIKDFRKFSTVEETEEVKSIPQSHPLPRPFLPQFWLWTKDTFLYLCLVLKFISEIHSFQRLS